jgi:aminoglycoside phosphotransferase family enzyme/gluconate kinase
MANPLIDKLRQPEIHGDPVDRVELIETHISWVLLAGPLAYKIKKPLNLGFLDFSRLEARRFFCEEEVRLNRRTAPQLYLNSIPITGTPERPILGGDGEPLEYAVRMRRFDSRLGFDRMLERGELSREQILDLARALAELHSIAGVAAADRDYGRFDRVAEPMRDNFDALAASRDDRLLTRIEALRNWTESQLASHRERIDARLAGGFVRECHGDAHLGNVTLFDGRATLFDCIEFSPELRWIDTACDLAFTLMDLHRRRASGLAWSLLDEYLTRTGDFCGLPLLPLYIVYRAMVRAKVQGLAREQAEQPERRASLDREIAAYLDLSHRMSSERRSGIVITMGLSGSGKSWLAERLVPQVGMVRVRSDVERKRLHGLSPGHRSRSSLGRDLYSAESTDRTYRRLRDAAGEIVAAGWTALVDATFLSRRRRARFEALAKRLGVPFAIVRCSAPEATLTQRLQARARRGEDPSEAGPEVLARQQRHFDALGPSERQSVVDVDTRAPDAVQATAARLDRLLASRGVADRHD